MSLNPTASSFVVSTGGRTSPGPGLAVTAKEFVPPGAGTGLTASAPAWQPPTTTEPTAEKPAPVPKRRAGGGAVSSKTGGKPWDIAEPPALLANVLDTYRAAEAKAIASLPPNAPIDDVISALCAFDERLLRATTYAYTNAFGSVTPLCFNMGALKDVDVARHAPVFAKAVADISTDISNAMPVHDDIEPRQLASLRSAATTVVSRLAANPIECEGGETLAELLCESCDPLAAGDIAAADWEHACDVSAHVMHFYVVAWLIALSRTAGQGLAGPALGARLTLVSNHRLAVMRQHVQTHPGAGCFVKCAFPMMTVTGVIAAAAPKATTQPGLRLWGDATDGAFVTTVHHFLSSPSTAGVRGIVDTSARTMWGIATVTAKHPADAPSHTSLGAIILYEALVGATEMERMGMVGQPMSLRSVFTAMAGVPTPMPYGGAPAAAAVRGAHTDALQTSSIPNRAADHSNGGDGGADAEALATLMAETDKFDTTLMLSLCLNAVTECEAVTVASSKRAVEAVECAYDGDSSALDSASRKMRQPLGTYLAACGKLINPSKLDHRDCIRTASEQVRAREQSTAHSTTLSRSAAGPARSALPAVRPPVTSGVSTSPFKADPEPSARRGQPVQRAETSPAVNPHPSNDADARCMDWGNPNPAPSAVW